MLYLKFVVEHGYKSAVLKTTDPGIFFILHVYTIALDIPWDWQASEDFINVSKIAEYKGEDYCTTLIGLYVFTGEDITSTFKGKGKVGPLKKFHKNPYNAVFMSIIVLQL